MDKKRIGLLSVVLLMLGCRSEGPSLSPPIAPTSDTAVAIEVTEETGVSTATLPPPPTLAAAATPTPPLPTPPTTEVASEGIWLRSIGDFGNDRNPLTGERVSNPEALNHRPIAVKISNAPANFVRPQAGLNDADLVFEHTAEGSVTRLTALFYDTLPQSVGPIRSARLIDVELPAMYDAGLAYSGASSGVNQRLNSSDFQTRLISTAEQGYYRTGDESKPFEHTLYGDVSGFRQALIAKGQDGPPAFTTVNAFSSIPPEGGEPAGYASIDYLWEVVEWRYDANDGRYYRWAAGQPILDANTGEQVSAANVVLIAPFHVEDPTICEEIANGTCRHLSVQIQLWGSGTGILLRDGRQYPVTWHREARTDSLTFSNASGTPFPLQIGNTWVQLVPSNYEDPVVVTP